MTVTLKRLGVDSLLERLERLKHLRVTIDFGSHKHPVSGLPMAHHAAIHEYGTAHIPARPALQRAVSEAEEDLVAGSASAVNAVVHEGADPVDALIPVAKRFREHVTESYESARDWAAPLADVTKKRKGHDKPLEDTHALIEAVGWAIREKGQFRKRGK